MKPAQVRAQLRRQKAIRLLKRAHRWSESDHDCAPHWVKNLTRRADELMAEAQQLEDGINERSRKSA